MSTDISPPQFRAFAIMQAGGAAQEWTYTPAPLGPDQVEIKIDVCGVCHSDLHQKNNDWKAGHYPMVCGHEIIGRVVAVGAEVKDRKIGDRVGVSPQTGSCQKCADCKRGEEQLCLNMMQVYNSPLPDPVQKYTYGGFQDRIRVPALWAFPIPEALPSIEAAPLLCAGLTTYSPLAHWKVGKGTKVGIVGVGGLGHIAVQFASKMGAEVTAITTSADKAPLAQHLGAQHVLVTSDEKAMTAAANSFDFILSTISGEKVNWNMYFDLVKPDGTFVIVGLPTNMSFDPMALVMKRVTLSGSILASHKHIKDMLEFAAKHGIKAMAETQPMTADGVNKAYDIVEKNKARFRVVLVAEAKN